MTKPASPLRSAALALALLALAATGCDRGDHPHNLERRAPDFQISDGHESINLAQLRGKVVVLNLWATWCVPCLQELPSLLELHHQMPALSIVAVSLDVNDDVYRHFLDQHHIDFTSVRDPDARIMGLYGTAQLPETYVIDKNGNIARKFIDAQHWTSPEITRYLAHLE